MMGARRFTIWAVAIFTAAVLSSLVGLLGWIFNQSLLPPFGGGVLKLIVLPMTTVWVAILAIVYFSERNRVRSRSHPET
jgi:hypothetical protein